jgi:hypothetical protein
MLEIVGEANAMADPLAAASLLMAMIAMLYGAWTPELTTAANSDLFDQLADRKSKNLPPIRSALIAKALPLAVGAWAGTTIFFGRAWRTLQTLQHPPKGAVLDDVGAAFVVVEAFTALLALSLIWQVGALAYRLAQCCGWVPLRR